MFNKHTASERRLHCCLEASALQPTATTTTAAAVAAATAAAAAVVLLVVGASARACPANNCGTQRG